MHVGSGSTGASLWSLPVVTELETFGVDQVAFCIAAAPSLGPLVPEELGSAFVDEVTEATKAEGAG